MDHISIINEYSGKTRICSSVDCLTMLLQSAGDTDLCDTIKGRYRTVTGGFKRLPALTGYSSIHEYLLSKGYEEIEPVFAQDGDLFIENGSHCLIYHNRFLFGVLDDDTFGFRKVNLLKAKDLIQAYRAP